MKGDFSSLENECIRLMKVGEGSPEKIGSELAKAIANYVDSITFSVPSGSFVTTVTGQATGTMNTSDVEVTKK